MKIRASQLYPQRVVRGIRNAWRFMVEDVWDVDPCTMPRWRGMGVKALRVVCLVFRGYRQDECSMHASALTFSSLMAIVPVLALSLALARGFGDADTAKEWIRGNITAWTETFRTVEEIPLDGADVVAPDAGLVGESELASQIERLVDSGFEKVDKISFKALGGVGLVFLLLMVIEVLGHVERSFNRVWGVSVGRSLWRRFTDYLSVLLVLPILILAAASLPVMDIISRCLDESSMAFVRALSNSGGFRNLTVLLMTTLVFSFLIMFMPNCRVRVRASLSGGFVAAALFLLWMSLCAALQIGAARYGKIYGGFAVVPILLAWVYVSWCLVLFAAEVAFAVQNCATYQMEQSSSTANIHARMTLALAVVVEAARAMHGEAQPLSVPKYAKQNGVPVRFLNDIIDDLVDAGFLGQLSMSDRTFALLRSPAALTVSEVTDVVMSSGARPSDLGLSGVDSPISEVVQKAIRGMDGALKDTKIQELCS